MGENSHCTAHAAGAEAHGAWEELGVEPYRHAEGVGSKGTEERVQQTAATLEMEPGFLPGVSE